MSLARTLVTILGSCLTSAAAPRPAAAATTTLRQLRVPDDPDHAYARAVRAALALGAHLLQQHRTRFLTAQLPQGAILHVLVTPKRWGALVDVQGRGLPGTGVGSACRAVEDFLTAFQWPEEDAHAPPTPDHADGRP